ncbi:PREDICTED: LOC107646977 isoform [Prunus dulcis]|uniref:PREDICTED: LOC107646977 isoform n=1 Tax=Prunus dulcis TaxID=3755 RepID=A0A5E4FLT8_PRUDU|nr:PREDICTED: LOC107646977 isoform [Prunus dulcis]
MCLIFPFTLNGATLNWFYRLNPRTINSFDSLKQTFVDHFMIHTDHIYSMDDLYMLCQGEDEPLLEYVTSFSPEYSRCPETDDLAAVGPFKSGLRESNFRYLVHSNPWNTYAELIDLR